MKLKDERSVMNAMRHTQDERSVCRIGRKRRKNYEGSRGREREGGGGENFTEYETRKWDEGPRGEVQGNGDPHSETSAMVVPF